MNKIVLLGNAITFFGAVLMICSGFIKSRKNILRAQSVQCLLMGSGNLVLGSVNGFIANMVSIVRNYICLKREFTIPLKVFFIAIQVALSAGFNNLGIIGWFPAISAAMFTWFLDTKSPTVLKTVIIATEVLWAIHDLTILNYVALVTDIFTIITNAAGIWMLNRPQKKTVG